MTVSQKRVGGCDLPIWDLYRDHHGLRIAVDGFTTSVSVLSAQATPNQRNVSSISVTQLEARIAQISSDIALQQEVLKSLERKKSAAQRQLNAIRDPIAQLPLEISSEIFLGCLTSQRKPGSHIAPLLLLNICNTWTDIALSTPAMWD
ncbi:hypothetical protein B0H16DRAFT_1331657, partial [Mycena metata]